MKRLLFAATMLFIGVLMCHAQDNQRSTQYAQPQGNFGLGAVIGEPTGIAWKYRINSVNALDGAIGFSPYNAYRVHVDYLWQSHPFDEYNLAMHYGAGVAFGSGRTTYYSNNGGVLFRNQEVGFGLRGVIGLNYLIKRSPVDLFFELAPLIVLTPNSTSGIDLGFGARVYF